MTPNPSTVVVTLPEVITGEITRNFGEISLYNQHADFEFGSASNSNSASPGLSHASRLLSHCVRTSHSMSTSHTASPTLARPMRRLSLRVEPARRSSATTPRTPTRLRLLLGLLLRVRLRLGPRARVREHHNRATAVRTSYRPGYNIYTRREIRLLARLQAYRPDRREVTLRRLPRLASLPGGNTTSSSRGAHFNRGGDYRLRSRHSRSPSLHGYR
jgi:hypothetical protein